MSEAFPEDAGSSLVEGFGRKRKCVGQGYAVEGSAQGTCPCKVAVAPCRAVRKVSGFQQNLPKSSFHRK